ncbi:bifunctional deaminase-reductase domain protein [Cellulomonas flavigena DSM 20109]|uniref:Bifunctional deaminase-reductase domain protein n=1 Tax=Cellulomonas flavigena (strain ATCC 482 / DSM 20109 / BCRC 11376 / JCM 18109 / NBRC 3775 / NCIMB 8073 / NRS 134) TaxID=446466 RepID=D5UEH0_CELFN|nr:dihydrofolate reductase family protein [Cellulomonas flavigena]ADG74630.1 bifunctional deaminase-reductase domain protein [Cellulomonas flavigena DSM 20109]
MPTAPHLDLLVPATRALPEDPHEPDLLALQARDRDVPLVRANMVASIDGAATGPDGRSGSLGTAADRRVFAVLRALADVVLVGAGTVRAEGYRELPVAAGLRAARAAAGFDARIELAVVTRSGDVPGDLAPDGVRPLVVTGRAGAARARATVGTDRVLEVPQDDDPDSPDLRVAVDALVTRGLPHVLAEGGPRLLADLLAADVVDELHLTTSALLLAGDARRPATGVPLAAPRGARLRHLLRATDDTLLTCWEVRSAIGSGS